MQVIALGKKFCLEFYKDSFTSGPLIFNIFMYDLLIILEEVDFASHTDDTTPFASEATPENVVSSLENYSASLFEWFSNNQI